MEGANNLPEKKSIIKLLYLMIVLTRCDLALFLKIV